MSRIREAFAQGKAFIPFITCGDPDLETTAAVVRAMSEAGADLIELGIPFSDPTAEGPVIQAANVRALSAGTTTDKIFDMVEDLRRTVTVPMVFMTYANVVFSYGTEKFLSRAAAAGMDGLILPDVPFEEKEDFAPACAAAGMDLISLIAPTSEGRIAAEELPPAPHTGGSSSWRRTKVSTHLCFVGFLKSSRKNLVELHKYRTYYQGIFIHKNHIDIASAVC